MSQLDKLLEIVTSQTANFKVYYMGLAKDSVINEFRSLPKKIANANKRIEAIRLKEREIDATYCKDGMIFDWTAFHNASATLRPLRKERDKLNALINKCTKYIALGEDTFVAKELKKIEESFDSRVQGLAIKLDQKSFSPDDLKFSNISTDPKLFDVYISSGNNKVHARSVLAAAESAYMVAHFRFIITNAK
jgi:hypothetical protein